MACNLGWAVPGIDLLWNTAGVGMSDILSEKPGSTSANVLLWYELFLFAAQNRLCREELIRRRSSLVPGVVTGPPHGSSLSILMSHKAAENSMGGIRDSQ